MLHNHVSVQVRTECLSKMTSQQGYKNYMNVIFLFCLFIKKQQNTLMNNRDWVKCQGCLKNTFDIFPLLYMDDRRWTVGLSGSYTTCEARPEIKSNGTFLPRDSRRSDWLGAFLQPLVKDVVKPALAWHWQSLSTSLSGQLCLCEWRSGSDTRSTLCKENQRKDSEAARC